MGFYSRGERPSSTQNTRTSGALWPRAGRGVSVDGRKIVTKRKYEG